jgi:hypothetical protein
MIYFIPMGIIHFLLLKYLFIIIMGINIPISIPIIIIPNSFRKNKIILFFWSFQLQFEQW